MCGFFVNADMFVRYFYEARMVALTHVFTLGWISLMIVGVLRQLAPVAFGLNLWRPSLLGFAVVLSGGEWYSIFGSLLAAACIWYAVAFVPVLWEFGQPLDRSTVFLIASWVCLSAVAAIGLRFTLVPL